MSNLLQKHQEFLEELEKLIAPVMDVSKNETFTREECEHLVLAIASDALIKGSSELYEEAISDIITANEYFTKKAKGV
jgi:hypothetical protein